LLHAQARHFAKHHDAAGVAVTRVSEAKIRGRFNAQFAAIEETLLQQLDTVYVTWRGVAWRGVA
jgi:hypothetical protein